MYVDLDVGFVHVCFAGFLSPPPPRGVCILRLHPVGFLSPPPPHGVCMLRLHPVGFVYACFMGVRSPLHFTCMCVAKMNPSSPLFARFLPASRTDAVAVRGRGQAPIGTGYAKVRWDRTGRVDIYRIGRGGTFRTPSK